MRKPDFTTLPQKRVQESGAGYVHYEVADRCLCGLSLGSFWDLQATTRPADCPSCVAAATLMGQATLTQQRVYTGAPAEDGKFEVFGLSAKKLVTSRRCVHCLQLESASQAACKGGSHHFRDVCANCLTEVPPLALHVCFRGGVNEDSH